MQTYTLFVECDCGGEMEAVVGDLSAAADGPIRINIDHAVSQTSFTCNDCGDTVYTGDFEDICFDGEAGD